MHNSRLLSVATTAAFSLVVVAAAAPSTAAQTPKLTIEQLIQIKHPSGHQWTPDGSHVWFTYDSAGVNNVWVAPADGSSPAKPLTTYADGQTGNGGFWSNDGRT